MVGTQKRKRSIQAVNGERMWTEIVEKAVKSLRKIMHNHTELKET